MPRNAAQQRLRPETRADSTCDDASLDREAYEYVQRHVDPSLVALDTEAADREPARTPESLTRAEEPVAIAQGALFVAAGVWPLVSPATFEAVTAPASDAWLVRTAGALMAVMGATIASAGLRGRITPETRLLAMASSFALGVVDLAYARRRRFPKVHMFDAAAHAGIIGAWLAAMIREPDDPEPAPV